MAEFLTDLRTVAREPADKLPMALSREGFWRRTPETDAVRKALEKKLTCDFQETPLAAFVQNIQDLAHVPVFLDRRSLDDVAVATDVPITATYNDVALQDVLALVLKDLGLTYTVADDVLLVTTPDVEEGEVTWAIYPVGDLVTSGRSVGDLHDMIMTTVAPDSWGTVGGAGSLHGIRGVTQALVVSQSGQVHRQIAALLAQLRRP